MTKPARMRTAGTAEVATARTASSARAHAPKPITMAGASALLDALHDVGPGASAAQLQAAMQKVPTASDMDLAAVLALVASSTGADPVPCAASLRLLQEQVLSSGRIVQTCLWACPHTCLRA